MQLWYIPFHPKTPVYLNNKMAKEKPEKRRMCVHGSDLMDIHLKK